MIRNLLIRGMIAGLVAGLLGFCVAKTFGEPAVDRASKRTQRLGIRTILPTT